MTYSKIQYIDGDDRFSTYPIRRASLFEMTKRQRSRMWTLSEVGFATDAIHYAEAEPAVKHALDLILAIFSIFDGVIMDNISANFVNEIVIREVKAFYATQNHMEEIHNETYSMQLTGIIKIPERIAELQASVTNHPQIKAIKDWAEKYLDAKLPLIERIFAGACIEKIVFSSMFCFLYWLGDQHRFPGLVVANGFIAADENLHVEFAALIYRELFDEPIPRKRLVQIVGSITALTIELARVMLPEKLQKMNKDLMEEYIKYTADGHLIAFKSTPIYEATQPFDFMDRINQLNRDNFFETQSTMYEHNDEELKNFDELDALLE